MMDIQALTPSQLYVNQKKLMQVSEWLCKKNIPNIEPITIKKLADRLLITDGHTRALAIWISGGRYIPCVWDTDDLDWAAYVSNISMCAEEGILSVKDLTSRIIPEENYKSLWLDRCSNLHNEWYYKILCQTDEIIYFSRTHISLPDFDIQPIDIGVSTGEYYQLLYQGVPAAYGCIEKYSFEFWEAADIRTYEKYRGNGFGYKITAYLTNKIIECGKTATCRTLPENTAMNKIIKKCGYNKLYE